MKSKQYLLHTSVCICIFCLGIAYAQYAASLSPAFSADPDELRERQGGNHPPEVKITAPENNSTFEWNTLIRYAISVEDVEDGASAYQEIASNEVFLEVMCLQDISKVDNYLRNATDADPTGLELLKTSDCFNCHAVKTRMAGPSFAELANRYSLAPDTVTMLAHRVVKGSVGHWGNAAMPPHPDLTEQQVAQMIQWVLTKAGDPDWDLYAGTEGAFRTRAMPESERNGVYVLTASYTDHGLEDKLRKRGQHTIVLRGK